MANINAAQQAKVFNGALFALAQKQYSLTNLLMGKAPQGQSEIGKKQTDAGAPIVRITDLEKNKGQTVSVDIIHDINKTPTMGDDKVAGRGDSMTFASDEIAIDQTRHMVDSGGAMLRQSTGISLPPAATKLLQGYYKRLEEERLLYHLAGARGSRYTRSMILPNATDKNFDKYMINKVQAPTHSRHFYAGDATSLEDMDASDLFSLSVVDRIWLSIQEMDNPLQYINFTEDKGADESPFYTMFVTARQWDDFYQSTSNKDWQQMQATALKRSGMFNHALFRGECLMYRGILIKPMQRQVEFQAGEDVKVSQNVQAATETTVTAAVKTHRAIVLGAQALGQAWGNAATKKGGKSHFSSHTEDTDHENSKEHSISWMNGCKKLRFEDRDGYVHDHGVIVADTAVSTS
jgi:N4-gp56 family major capsid protein